MSEFNKLPLAKLKELCKSLGLKTTGKKSILVARLLRLNNPCNSPGLVPSNDQDETLNTFNVPEISETQLSLSKISWTWFGKHVLSEANVQSSSLGIRDSSNVSDVTIQGSIRFWMSRFYNLIEFNLDEWKDFEINQITALSSDFILAEESSQSKIRIHLVVLETGQVLDSCDPLTDSKLEFWKTWISQFNDKDGSLISRIESWDSDYPNNISKRISRDSIEFKIATRFTLVHSKGLNAGSQSLVQRKKNSLDPIKCLITVPFDNAIVSVHLSWRGIPFVLIFILNYR